MLDAALRALDKISELLKYREQKKRDFFTNVLLPLYEDLTLVNSNYIEILEDCRSKIERTQTPLTEIAEELRRRRLEYAGLRVKVKAVSNALSDAELDPIVKRFLNFALAQFPDDKMIYLNTAATLCLNAIYREIDTGEVDLFHSHISRQGLAGGIHDEIKAVQRHWVNVSDAYARVKLWVYQ